MGYNVIGVYRWILTKFSLSFSEYRLTDVIPWGLALPLTATPKWVTKRGNKIHMYVCKKINAKTSVISYLRVPEYGMTNGSKLRVSFTPDSTPERGNTSYSCLCKTCQG